MVISSSLNFITRKNELFFRVFSSLLGLLFLVSACGTTDRARLKESRTAFLQEDFPKAEAALFTLDVFKNSQNRLEHFYWLSSIAMSEGEFEKAAYFLNRARELALSSRSSAGAFDWFSRDYKSNPIEFSYIHYMLVMSYSLLAETGQSPEWHTPQIKDDKGNILVDAQDHTIHKFDPSEIARFRQKARAELLAWDTFLETLKRTYPTQNFYKEDLWARLLASFVQGGSSDNNERRTAELLAENAREIFDKEFKRYPSAKNSGSDVQDLVDRLKKRSEDRKNADSLFVLEAGVIAPYKIKRFHLGLSTIFSGIKDPLLRRQMEQIGIQVLLSTAPEFGLIAVGGGITGAFGGDDDEFEGPPRYFSDAVDRSFGFEIRFPTMTYPPSDTRVSLHLTDVKNQKSNDYKLAVVSPLQEMVATEIKSREGSEMFAKALSIGGQYVAILIPAVKAYQAADRNGNVFQKLAILAGYFIAKKAIDNANNPDLRSWSTLPQLIAANLVPAPPGAYNAKVVLENRFGREEKDLGKLIFGSPTSLLVRQRIGTVPILNYRDDEDQKSAQLH